MDLPGPSTEAPAEYAPVRFEPPSIRYEHARWWFLRALGFIYAVAFLSLARQVLPLIGHDGLLPADLYLERLHDYFGSTSRGFFQVPSLFWFGSSDALLLDLAWIGFGLSLLMMLGLSHVLLMLFLWFLYMSYVHVGQTFYGYGWETMTLEAGFLALFLCPLTTLRPSRQAPTPLALMWLYRWMLFRVMFGAGLIKIRGDPCWRDLTCLVYHYETQPIPNPISWYLHHMPLWFQMAGCLFNHFVELVVPWFYLGPRRLRVAGGIFTVIFQSILILSGNLSWLNWLTIVIAIPLFDDRWWTALPGRARSSEPAVPTFDDGSGLARWLGTSRRQRIVVGVLVALLALLSFFPIANMLSPHQVMNTSFDRLHLMNTYGAFGSVGKVRHEIVLEGSDDGEKWKAYEFLAKPGDPNRRPPFIAPYQSRIDWQVWFAAMESPSSNPWLIHMICKLLEGDRGTLSLLRTNPFPHEPPRQIRCAYYEYRFSKPEERAQGIWWDRTYLGLWLAPLSLDTPELQRFMRAYGWID